MCMKFENITVNKGLSDGICSVIYVRGIIVIFDGVFLDSDNAVT
jgi:hypothetical protein